jgi:hypothetical protein
MMVIVRGLKWGGALLVAGLLPFAEASELDAVGAAEDVKTLAAHFAEPPVACRPGTYWWWQGQGATREGIAEQLQQMKEAGLGIAHTVNFLQDTWPVVEGYPGFLSPGTPEWTDMVVAAIQEAAKVGIKYELSPYQNWPFRGWETPDDHTENMLLKSSVVLKGPRRFEGEIPRLSKEGNINDINTFAHYSNRRMKTGRKGPWEPQLVAVVLAKRGEPGKVLASDVSADFRLGVEIPEGEWQLSCFWRVCGYRDVLDHYSAAALEGHLERTVKPILEKLPAELVGNTFQAIYCDNIEGFFASAWSKELPQFFLKQRGYDLMPYLPLLFDQAKEACALQFSLPRGKPSEVRNRIASDFAQTLKELMQEQFFGTMRQWANRHGIKARAELHSPVRGDYVDAYGEVDIPEFEQFKGHMDLGRGQWSAKFAANQYGKRVVACESFTYLTPHFRATPHNIREGTDEIFAFGGTRINNHGWPYSPCKAAWPGWFFYASSNLNPNNSWFPCYRALADYTARSSMLLRSGRPVVDLCFYGSDKNRGLDDCGLEDRIMPIANATPPTGLYDRISDKVLRTRMEFRDGVLAAGFGRYRLLVLRPEAACMPLETLERLEALVNAGARVVALALPQSVPGFHDHVAQEEKLKTIAARLFPTTAGITPRQVGQGLTWFCKSADLEKIALSQGIEPYVRGIAVDYLHRQGDDFDLFYLYNPGKAPVQGRAGFRAEGRPELWNAMTGEIAPAQAVTNDGFVEIPLEIPPKTGRMILFRRDGAAAGKAPVQWSAPVVMAELKGPWQVRFEHVDRRPAFTQTLAKLADWTALDELKTFSGGGIYKQSFDLEKLPKEGSRMSLNLGKVCDAAKVTLNGQFIGTVIETPFRIYLPAAHLKPRWNELEIAVYNRMENAIIPIAGSNEEIRGKIMGNQKSKWNIDTPVAHPSGLLGPVTLEVETVQP